MIDDAICPCCDVRHLSGLISRHVEDLDSSGCDFDLMIVEMPVPLDCGKLSSQVFRDEILDADQWSLGIGRLEQQALKNFVGNALAIMMERATRPSIPHHVRRLNMNL